MPQAYRYRYQIFILLISTFFLAGCGGSANQAVISEAEPSFAPEMAQNSADSVDGQSTLPGDDTNTALEASAVERVIIYRGDIEMVVADISTTVDDITALATAEGGYLSESTIDRSEYRLTGNVTIQVDAKNYEATMEALRQMAITVRRENTDSQDVTEEYVDLQARQINLEHTAAALQEMLDLQQANGNVEDVLAIHRELTSVREDIERIEGRVRYLQNQSALATITVRLYPEENPEPEWVAAWQPFKVAQDAWQTLVTVLQGLGDAAIWSAICGLPLFILALIPLFALRWGYKRWGKKWLGSKSKSAPKTDDDAV